jgi:Mismatch repair ATPase (MutS family)
MQYLFYILIAVLGIVIWSMFSEYQHQKRILQNIKKQWGGVPEEEYTAEKFLSLQTYYRSIQEEGPDVDDITWNDLDMDEIYMLMNNTQSSIGEEYLYALLRKPSYSAAELKERNRLMKFFAENEEARISLQSKIYSVGKIRRISVYEYINRLQEQDTKGNLGHYLMLAGLLLSVALIFIKPGIGGFCTVLLVINNIIQYYRVKAEIENYLMIFSYIIRLLDGVKEIYKLDIPEIKEYTQALKQEADHFKRFKKGAVWLVPKQPSGDFAEVLLDYIRMLTHIDLIKYNNMLSFFKNNRDRLNRIYQNIGILDSMLAAASFREMLPGFCEPELSNNGHVGITATNLYHPLIDEPVLNSISENKSVLLTGSNASGKSTFIKTLAINAILAQTIFTSTSSYYQGNFFMICSSMALKDSIFSKESYYIVEIKSLKRILDRVNDKIPVLCFIDEVLRGTNTLERIAASSRILSSLARKNTMVFAATHDIELTHIMEMDYANYHFQERIENHEILFDYKLYKGRAVSKNAIKLLDMLGYPKSIIASAEEAAEEFLEKGEWSSIL